MPHIKYIDKNMRADGLAVIQQANDIIAEYTAKGFDLTLRQLYYQFVARGLLGNTQQNYSRLGDIVSDGRLMGLIDWDHITDRTRGVENVGTWDSPAAIIATCINVFKIDKWETQPYRVEVWIEKEALAGVFERVCQELRVPHLSCRGYTSQSEMWRAGRRLMEYREGGQTPLILHFGDHDPSGIDMSRDIVERLEMFAEGEIEFKRIALNMDQVNAYKPPPNPVKKTDGRWKAYEAKFKTSSSWELDALDPDVLAQMVRDEVDAILDTDAWETATEEEDEHRRKLKAVAKDWDKVTRKL